MSELAYIALGANLGDPVNTLKAAIHAIEQTSGIELRKCSSFYRTAPIDSSGPDYVNAVIEVRTTLQAEALLEQLLRIESDYGRVRPAGVHNAPRTLDLDLLLYGDKTQQTPFLHLPHPRMHQRAFVLVPLTEIAPTVTIPGLGLAKDFLFGVANQAIEKMDK